MRTSNVKGSNLLRRMEYVGERFGPAAWESVLAALPRDDARLLQPRILASSWYPFALYNRLDETICRVVGDGNLDLCTEMGIDSAHRALSGTYRMYLKDGAAALLGRLAALHRSFYDAGSMEVTTAEAGRALIRTTYVPCSSVTNCKVAAGFYKTVVELCGGRDVRVSEGRCSAHGAPFCLFQVRWTEGSPVA